MKNTLLFIAVALLLTGCQPSAGDATSFVEKSVRERMKDPDAADFDNVKFYPDDSPQGEEISGSVCGYVNGKNALGAYTGRVRFYSRITVSNGGRSAEFSPPNIEDKGNAISVAAMDQVWSQSCKAS